MALRIKYNISFDAKYREGGSASGRGDILLLPGFEKMTQEQKDKQFKIQAKNLAYKIGRGKTVKEVVVKTALRTGIINL